MPPGAIMLIVVVVVLIVALGLPLAWFNKLVRLRQLIRESWGNVDVQLKRRYDLIPNLVNIVKGYATHEQQTLQMVIDARNRAQSNSGAIGAQADDERKLVDATRQLFAIVENYPQLKASANFAALQQELINTEDRIAAARRFYNANVRDYNVSRTTFPTMLVAGLGDFPPQDYFEVDDYTVRSAGGVADMIRIIPLIVMYMLLSLFQSGCATNVIPPARPQEPVTVYLTDYGRHSSVIIPSNNGGGDYDEWAFGDYEFFAKGDTRWWVAILAMLHSPQATLGRRQIKNASMVSQESLMKALGDCRRLMKFEASACGPRPWSSSSTPNSATAPTSRCTARTARFITCLIRSPIGSCTTAITSPRTGCRRLGCEICGPAIYSNFKLAEISPQPVGSSTTQPTTQKK